MAASWDALYGPDRLTEYTALKNFNTKDNILRKGDYNFSGTNWETHYKSMLKDSYKEYQTVGVEQKTQAKAIKEKHGSINVITQDGSRNYALTSEDYGEHRGRRSQAQAKIDKETHIVDFSPKYNVTVPLVSSSVYQNCFKKSNNLSDSYNDRMKTEERTKDVRLTHFDLGTTNERLSTETRHSFNDALFHASADTENKALEKQKNKNRSNIFQSGDWNAPNRNLAKRTVTSEQFGAKRYPSKGEERLSRRSLEKPVSQYHDADVADYKKTHVVFGNSPASISTFYKKDFMIDKRKYAEKPEKAGPPPSSMVLQRCDAATKPESINRSDYVPFQNLSCSKDASNDLAKNKTFHSQNHIKMTQASDNVSSSKLTTFTKNVFHQPPSDALTLYHERAPPSMYRYLDTDSALLKPRSSPYQSEVKDKFGIPETSGRSFVYAEDKERQKQDNATHFSFGTDLDGRSTEQTTQFSKPMKIDPKIRAAGVKDLGISSFGKIYDKTHVDTSCLHVKKNKQPSSEKTASIMQNDYKPLANRSFTSPQQRLMETLAKYPLKIEPSHFFHMNNCEGPLTSKTKMDFIHPNRGQFATR